MTALQTPGCLSQAWADYCDALKAGGDWILAARGTQDALDRCEGLRMLTRLMRYGLEASVEFSDPDFPVFYQPSHETLKIMSDNPDTLHFMATIRDDAEYQISGSRGSVARIVFTTLARAGNGAGLVLQSGVASDALTVDSEGRFTLVVSPKAYPGNWLPLKPGAQLVLVRAIFLNRAAELAPTLRIERMGAPMAPPCLTTAALSARLAAASRIALDTARAVASYADELRSRGWMNKLIEDPSLWGAGDPGARYHHGAWSLASHEALLIQVRPPDCLFWNLQINNHWTESLDYLHHNIHVNKANVISDADGVVRVVIAHRDPGLPNWLDTAGHSNGTMLARYIDADRTPEVRCNVVPFDSLQRA